MDDSRSGARIGFVATPAFIASWAEQHWQTFQRASNNVSPYFDTECRTSTELQPLSL